MRHLKPEELLDVAEGAADESVLAHLHRCERCRADAAQLTTTLAAVSDVDVPEPSPLFWNHLSARVRHAVASEPVPVASRWFSWTLAGVAGAIVLALAVAIQWRDRVPVPAAEVATVSPMDVVLPVADRLTDDASLELLADLASDLDWDDAAEAGLSLSSGGVDRVVVELTALERETLHRLLTTEMAGKVL